MCIKITQDILGIMIENSNNCKAYSSLFLKINIFSYNKISENYTRYYRVHNKKQNID